MISDGEGNEAKIAAAQRKYKPEQIWKRYQLAHSNSDGKYTGTLKRSIFLKLVRAATSVDLKTLAALDNVSVRYGSENFQSGKVKETRKETCCGQKNKKLECV